MHILKYRLYVSMHPLHIYMLYTYISIPLSVSLFICLPTYLCIPKLNVAQIKFFISQG